MITSTNVATENGRAAELSNGKFTVLADGGTEHFRPGEYFTAAMAACMNMTVQRILRDRGLTCEQVQLFVDLNRDDPDNITFRIRGELPGLSAEDKRSVLEEAQNCAVCRLMRAQKTFVLED